MPNNYDAAAWFYDALAQLVFGKALVKAQRFLIQCIKPQTSILIVGGGTGWILEEIACVQASTLKITYVEVSGRMIGLSKKRDYLQNEVGFIHAAIEDCKLVQQYDVILTPFIFDNFTEKHIRLVFAQLHQTLKPGGLWLFADFQVQDNHQGKWQKFILKTMYWFFGWLCKVETKNLVKMDAFFIRQKYTLVRERLFYKGFITSKVYQKNIKF